MPNFESEPPLVPAPLFPAATPPPSRLFVGPFGLRAGWGILIYLLGAALLAALFYVSLGAATGRLKSMRQNQASHAAEREAAKAAHLPPPVHPMHVSDTLIGEASMSAAEILAAVGLAFVERRRFGVYGAGSRGLRNLLPGAIWGLLAMGLLIALLRAFHLLAFDGQLLHGTAIETYGGAWFLMFFLVGLSEEFLLRGYLQYTLTRGFFSFGERILPANPRLAAYLLSGFITSVLFFVAHLGNPGENKAGLAGVFLAGVLFCYALWRTGSLWWGIGFHMTWDWSQNYLYGVADSGSISAGRLFATHPMGNPLLSGGGDGPEGSLLLIPVLLLIFVVLRLHPLARQPPLESEGETPVSLHISAASPIA